MPGIDFQRFPVAEARILRETHQVKTLARTGEGTRTWYPPAPISVAPNQPFHIHRTLTAYCAYYHRWRTHLSLGKDAPQSRLRTPRRVTGIRLDANAVSSACRTCAGFARHCADAVIMYHSTF